MRRIQLAAVAGGIVLIAAFGALAFMTHHDVHTVGETLVDQNNAMMQKLNSIADAQSNIQARDKIPGLPVLSDRDPVKKDPEQNYAALAGETHMTVQQIKEVLGQAQKSNDLTVQAEVAFAEGRFAKAQRLYHEANEQESHRAALRRRRTSWAKASLHCLGDYVHAAAILAEAAALLQKLPQGPEGNAALWAETQSYQGRTQLFLYAKLTGKDRVDCFGCDPLHRRIVEVLHARTQRQEWAREKDFFARGELGEQGELASGEARNSRLTRAIEAANKGADGFHCRGLSQSMGRDAGSHGSSALRQSLASYSPRSGPGSWHRPLGAPPALVTYSRTRFRSAWAVTQNLLGKRLGELAKLASGSERKRLLDEAAKAFKSALEVRTRKDLPNDWAATSVSLASLRDEQAKLASGSEQLPLFAEGRGRCVGRP